MSFSVLCRVLFSYNYCMVMVCLFDCLMVCLFVCLFGCLVVWLFGCGCCCCCSSSSSSSSCFSYTLCICFPPKNHKGQPPRLCGAASTSQGCEGTLQATALVASRAPCDAPCFCFASCKKA